MEYVDSLTHETLHHVDSLIDITDSVRTALITDEELDDDHKEIFNLIRNKEPSIATSKTIAVFRIGNGSREEIRAKILEPGTKLGFLNSDGSTLAKVLLTKVTNGDKIVREKLNTYISTSGKDKNAADFAIVVDHSGLVDEDIKGLVLLRDLLDLPRNKMSDRIMSHPVITTFIYKRWPKWLFIAMAAVYVFFVIFYSFYVLFLFTINPKFNDANDNSWPTMLFGYPYNCTAPVPLGQKPPLCNRATQQPNPFESCSKDDPWMCATEIIFLASLVILSLQELWQFLALRMDYVREVENWFQILIHLMSLASFVIREPEQRSVISAVAIGLAWIELIFLYGGFPSDRGNFSIMYYESSKKVLKIAMSLFLLVVAYGTGFYILHYADDDMNDSPFSMITKSMMTSFTWIMGEFEFDDLWASGQKTAWMEFVTMALFVAMLIFGTLILISLIVATIIIDLEPLREEARATSLRNQAHYAIQMRVARKPLKKLCGMVGLDLSNYMMPEMEMRVCHHSVCGKPRCGYEKLDEKIKNNLQKILLSKGVDIS